MNTRLLAEHLKQIQHSFKVINELWEIYNSHGDHVNSVLTENYPFDSDFNELTAEVIHWTNEAIEKLQ